MIRRKQKKMWCLTIICLFIVLLTGCGDGIKDEEQIQVDLESYLKKDTSTQNERVIEVNIEKRKTEENQKLDTVWCNVKTEDEHYSYEKKVILTYNLYDEGGWILDEISVNDSSEWNISPITGVSDEEIVTSLDGINILVENETWKIMQDNITSCSVEKQETDLEAKTDVVTLSLKIDDLLVEASGKLVVNYIFDDKWIIESISESENFTSTVKAGLALNVTDEYLFNALSDQIVVYGVGDATQNITLKREELSDLVIESQESSSKGKEQTYICSCKLTKAHADFELNAKIMYTYSGEWTVESIAVDAKCVSVRLDGNWTGTMRQKTCELNITEVNQDGMVTGVFTYYDGAGSFYVSGKIDLNNLTINLQAGDEIVVGINKYGNAYGTNDISAQLNVNDSTISGRERGSFIVSQ